MLFSKNDGRANEVVLYKTKPNMILGCKKVIYGVVLLAIVFILSPSVIQFIGKMQVYLISNIQLPLTRYTAIALFVVILAIIVYMIWQLISWYSIEYILTDSKIIVKSGIISSKRNYMPYSTIQDINTSQSIFARLFNVGTVSTFSAYDNNQIKLENISNPSEVEEIIFSNMMGYRSFQEPHRQFANRSPDNMRFNQNFADENDYHDEFEPITPIGHERNSYQRREYEYYPEEFSFQRDPVNRYEYEDELDYNMSRAMNNSNDNIRYEGAPNTFSSDSHYNSVMNDYSREDEMYYQDNEPEIHYNNDGDKYYQNEQKHVDKKQDSSETVIRRHFDKFRK